MLDDVLEHVYIAARNTLSLPETDSTPAIIVVNPDKARIVRGLVNAGVLHDEDRPRDGDVMRYRMSYTGGGFTQAWVGRGRWAPRVARVDCSAEASRVILTLLFVLANVCQVPGIGPRSRPVSVRHAEGRRGVGAVHYSATCRAELRSSQAQPCVLRLRGAIGALDCSGGVISAGARCSSAPTPLDTIRGACCGAGCCFP